MKPALDTGTLSPAVATLVEQAHHADLMGHREIARRRYETALYLLRDTEAGAASAIIRRVARTYIDEGQPEAAMDCLIAARAIAEAMDDTAGIAHAMNWQAVAHGHRGDLDNAESLFADASEFAIRGDDEPLLAMVAQNRGITASMRGDLHAALSHYATSLATYRALELKQNIGPLLNNMGLVYTQLDRLDEAQAAYDEAITHCAAIGDRSHRLLALVNSADLWIERGQVDRAFDLCHTVLSEATEASDHRVIAEAHKHLGVIARGRGELETAERELKAAYDDAMRREDLLLAAETVREQAELYEQMGKARETLLALTQSHQLFTKLRAQRDLADLKRRVARLESRFYIIVKRWAQTIESKDVYTLGHCERVADYACALARDVGMDDITMFWFRVGAVLHDVGKIDVPSEILNKPGPLTAEERAVMERHPAIGYDLLRDIEFPWDILPIVRSHHERWDGRGYPDGLAGEDIPLPARITCVADVFDALTTDRPYRRAFSREDALKMMAKDSGKLFDADLFARFERLIHASPNLYQTPPTSFIAAVAS